MDGLIIGLLLPFAGTTLGAACVFLMKKQMPDLVQKPYWDSLPVSW